MTGSAGRQCLNILQNMYCGNNLDDTGVRIYFCYLYQKMQKWSFIIKNGNVQGAVNMI